MFPLNSICSFLVLLRNVTTGRQIGFLSLEGTTAVEGHRMILIDLSEVLLGFGEGSDLGVLGENLR